MSIFNFQFSIFNSKKLKAGSWKLEAGFTLVELMIVVAILGILAAIVLPEFQNQSQFAKESAAKANLKILREAIERYALDHNGVPPGYTNNNPNSIPNNLAFNAQVILSKKYLSAKPKNPFNDLTFIRVLINTQTLDEAVVAALPAASYGWVYHPATKTVKLNKTGTDSTGKRYFDY